MNDTDHGLQIAARLRSLRTARDMNKAQFCRLLKLRPQNYDRYEKGRIPRAASLARIADACNVSVDWLLGREDTKPAERTTDQDIPQLEAVTPWAKPSFITPEGWAEQVVHAQYCYEVHKRLSSEGRETYIVEDDASRVALVERKRRS